MAKVLLAEDNPDTAASLRTILEIEGGHRVRTVPNGQEATAALINDPPEVILLDLGLPIVSGWDVLKLMRQLPEWEKIPVVVMTGRGDDDARRALADFAVEAVFTKPYDPLELLAAVERAVRQGTTG